MTTTTPTADVLRHVAWHHDYPAVNVKDRHGYAGTVDYDGEPLDLPAIFAELHAAGVDTEPLYDLARTSFWDMLQDVGQEHGYAKVWSAGRMDGYAMPDGRPLWAEVLDRDDPRTDPAVNRAELERLEDPDQVGDYYEADALVARDQFLAFAVEARGLMDHARHDYYQMLVQERDDLRRRQDDAIVRSEN